MDDDANREAALAGVPPEISQAASFQRWHKAQRGAGNVLEHADVLWSLSTDGGAAEFWAMRVAVRVHAEDRLKANEVVISRPDTSVVALYRPAATLDETAVVLVREFRSPARTPDGFVRELPGGSGPAVEPVAQAVAELLEETGFAVAPERLRAHGSRQVAASHSTHHAYLYSARITDAELAGLRGQTGSLGQGGTERTWVEVTTFGEIVRGRLVDWSVLGMLSQVLLDK